MNFFLYSSQHARWAYKYPGIKDVKSSKDIPLQVLTEPPRVTKLINLFITNLLQFISDPHS